MNENKHPVRISRRAFLGQAAVLGIGSAVAALLGGCAPTPAPEPPETSDATEAPEATQAPEATDAPEATSADTTAAEQYELLNWHPLSASDGDAWAALVEEFNAAHSDQGVSILQEVVTEGLGTKILTSFAAGTPPDFGYVAGVNVDFVQKGVITELDDLMESAGLNYSDFFEQRLEDSRYQGKLFVLPIDAVSLQMLINSDHAEEAGLDLASPPQTGEEVVDWALQMTQRDGETVTRSGFLLTGSGTLPSYVWGIVAEQIGFERFDEGFTTVNVVNDACRESAQWLLDMFDEHKVSDRDIADRYKAFGTGQSSIFWTGPWTLSGFIEQGINLTSAVMPQIGSQPWTEAWTTGLEMYKQDDADRMLATAKAFTWLSDNALTFAMARGGTARKSIRALPEYQQGGKIPWELRVPFEDGLEFAASGSPKVVGGGQMDYEGGAAQWLDPVWLGEMDIEEGLQNLQDGWQALLDEANAA